MRESGVRFPPAEPLDQAERYKLKTSKFGRPRCTRRAPARQGAYRQAGRSDGQLGVQLGFHGFGPEHLDAEELDRILECDPPEKRGGVTSETWRSSEFGMARIGVCRPLERISPGRLSPTEMAGIPPTTEFSPPEPV
jgi:hypothetical protein